jgi:phage tail-like protein
MSIGLGTIEEVGRNFNFVLEFGTESFGIFRECSGLEGTTEVLEDAQGGRPGVIKKPGRTTFSDITLKWGVTTSPKMWITWRADIMAGKKPTPKKSGSIVMFDLAGKREFARWNFSGAWPTKYTGPAFDARGNEIALETIVLAIDWLERA